MKMDYLKNRWIRKLQQKADEFTVFTLKNENRQCYGCHSKLTTGMEVAGRPPQGLLGKWMVLCLDCYHDVKLIAKNAVGDDQE